jgi:hypothetical protein
MDRAEAKSIVAKELAEFAARSCEQLVASIKHDDVKKLSASQVLTSKSSSTYSGIRILMAICALWQHYGFDRRWWLARVYADHRFFDHEAGRDTAIGSLVGNARNIFVVKSVN